MVDSIFSILQLDFSTVLTVSDLFYFMVQFVVGIGILVWCLNFIKYLTTVFMGRGFR